MELGDLYIQANGHYPSLYETISRFCQRCSQPGNGYTPTEAVVILSSLFCRLEGISTWEVNPIITTFFGTSFKTKVVQKWFSWRVAQIPHVGRTEDDDSEVRSRERDCRGASSGGAISKRLT